MNDWFENDAFWVMMAPFMFDQARWEGTPAEVDAISELLGLGPQTAVLDLACGPGRHSLELARRGHRVTGVDRTRPYLQEARKRAADEGLALEFLESDMRSFRRPDSFDVVLSLFTSFGYFKEPAQNLEALRNMYQALHVGGLLLIETMGKEVLARVHQHRDWFEMDGVFWLQERNVSENWSWMDARWILVNGQVKEEFSFGHWIYSAVELGQMLKEAGFAQVDVYGDIQGRPYDTTARRLVALARK